MEDAAAGELLLIDGLLLTADGSPVAGAIVEIWQTDHQGVYLHPGDPGIAARDEAFQGYGESATDASGAWSFRTILPEIYGGRPRHIHAKVKIDGETALITQIYFSGGDISLNWQASRSPAPSRRRCAAYASQDSGFTEDQGTPRRSNDAIGSRTAPQAAAERHPRWDDSTGR